jgi:8-oxo-dGTP diphosphatase
MAKSSRKPVLAAGGIVVRKGAKPLVAIVQRRRDDAWVLPKGKLKPNEQPIAAAQREAREETGADVRVHEFLGVISYRNSSGPKLAHFWRMEAVGGAGAKLMDDIKAVAWLPLPAAIDRLSLTREHAFLRNVGRKALKRTRKKARGKPRDEKPVEDLARQVLVEPAVEPAPAIAGAALAPPDKALAPRAKPAKPQPSWQALARLTKTRLGKRWHAAIGRTRRAG